MQYDEPKIQTQEQEEYEYGVLVSSNTFLVTDDVANQRRAVCNSCPKQLLFAGVIKYCEDCGCALRLRTKISYVPCPNGKWPAL